MTNLPIDPYLNGIIEQLCNNPCLVLTAPPGAGKTTRLPPALVNAPFMQGQTCLVLLPRRIAARSAAKRVSHELGQKLGGVSGYHVRMEKKASPQTRILYVTEGIASAMLQNDPFLTGVGAVILDEFHERSLEADLCLAMLKEVRNSGREDLRLVVSSATIDPTPISEYLGAAVFDVPGRPYPVEVSHVKSPPVDLAEATAKSIRELWPNRPQNGDMLVFLPGAGEIRKVLGIIEDWAKSKALVLVLHGDLSPDEQDLVFRPSELPKIILSTNIAESSLTIDGVTAVVDSGLMRVIAFDPASGLPRLETVRCGLDNATQRAGRAGRTSPGIALRLWTRHDELSMQERIAPEIERADLSSTVLELANWGHPEPENFGWFEKPSPERLSYAKSTLKSLKAIDISGKITQLGQKLLQIPLHPRLALLLLSANDLGLANEAAKICAIIENRDLISGFRGDIKVTAHDSDVLFRLDLLDELERSNFSHEISRSYGVDGRSAKAIAREADRLCGLLPKSRVSPPKDADKALRKLIFAAYPDRVAVKTEGERYLLADGGGAVLSKDSGVMKSPIISCVKLDSPKRGERADAVIRMASAVDEEWLDLEESVEHYFDEQTRRVVAQRALKYRNLPIKKVKIPVNPEIADKILNQAALKDPFKAFKPDESALLAIARQNFVAKTLGAAKFPEFSWDKLAEHACIGRSSFDELQRLDLVRETQNLLSWEEQTALNRLAPLKITLGGGAVADVEYQEDGPPVLRAKLQWLFGVSQTPTVADGRVPVLIHLLAPSGRPLQVTANLETFWKNVYPEVRKEMRGRYPKHHWPEDPLATQAMGRSTLKKNLPPGK